jgi:hypothetical protein
VLSTQREQPRVCRSARAVVRFCFVALLFYIESTVRQERFSSGSSPARPLALKAVSPYLAALGGIWI